MSSVSSLLFQLLLCRTLSHNVDAKDVAGNVGGLRCLIIRYTHSSAFCNREAIFSRAVQLL